MSGPISDERLLERFSRKDPEAFSHILDAYQVRVHGFVRRMCRNEDEALDITQEVFVRAFQALPRFDGRSSLRTWLFRIAHNLCIDRVRKSERRVVETRLEAGEDGEFIHEPTDDRWNPEQVVLNQELQSVVETALEGLSEKLRTVLLLHDREDMDYKEIAQALDVPIGTVKSRLFLARNQLQRAVSDYWNEKVNG